MNLDLMPELAWKSGLVAGAALAGASLLRVRPATERVALLRLGVVMVLALPLLAAVMPALRIETPALAPPAEAPVVPPAVPRSAPSPAITTASSRSIIEPEVGSLPTAHSDWRIDPVAAALVLWGAGFSFLMLRLLAGVALLHRWTRYAEPVADTRWLAALERAAHGRNQPVLRATPRVNSPLSWGWRPATILLDPAALDEAGRADAVLAHEMGHVRHGDWLFLMASRLLVAVFWFNPLVWILQRELARQSEQAADAWAARRIGRIDYASALVAMAARGRPHAALGMAAPKGELTRRVTAIMQGAAASGKPWRAAFAITACLGFATPLAAIELVPKLLASAGPPARPIPLMASAASTAQVTPPLRLATALHQGEQASALLETAVPPGAGPVKTTGHEDEIRGGGSAAIRTRNGFQVEVSGNVRTGVIVSSPVQIGAPLPLPAPPLPPPSPLAPPPPPLPVPPDVSAGMREGADQMRQGAAEMDAGADDMERSMAAAPMSPVAREGPAQVAEMRRQAAEMRRQADEINARADQA